MLSSYKLAEANDARFTPPKNRYNTLNESYCKGGVAVGDVSEGWEGYTWKVYFNENGEVFLNRTDTDVHVKLFEETGIEQIDFCFDQNMNVIVVYAKGGYSYLYAYKNSVYEKQYLGEGITYPRCFLDRLHKEEASESDVIIAYLKDHEVCFLVQREAYGIEHKTGKRDPKKTMLWKAGISEDGRFLFQWR